MKRVVSMGSKVAGWGWWRIVGRAAAWAACLAGLAHVGMRSMVAFAEPARSADRRVALAATDALALPSASAPAVAASSPMPCASAVVVQTASNGEPGVLADGRTVLNRASVPDLVKLPGIGQKRAEAIVELRQRKGGFRSLRDLLRVRGFGPKTLARLAPLLVVDAPAGPAAPDGSAAARTNGSGRP